MTLRHRTLDATAFRAVEVMLGWVIVLIPLAVFAAVATSVGKYGFGVVRGLAIYVGVAALGLAIQVLVVYQAWIVFVARMPLSRFWSGATMVASSIRRPAAWSRVNTG